MIHWFIVFFLDLKWIIYEEPNPILVLDLEIKQGNLLKSFQRTLLCVSVLHVDKDKTCENEFV